MRITVHPETRIGAGKRVTAASEVFDQDDGDGLVGPWRAYGWTGFDFASRKAGAPFAIGIPATCAAGRRAVTGRR